MESITVSGASGAIGRRVVRQLAADPQIHRVIAVDRASPAVVPSKAEIHKIDILNGDLVPAFSGARCLVHLAEADGRQNDGERMLALADRVFDAAAEAGVSHLVVLSSALVYGAVEDNPVPILETQDPNPHEELAYAVAKVEMERRARAWAEADGRSVSILRPTTTLSERGAGWVAKALRAATSVRAEQVDPPLQFLHHDDLASAVCLVAKRSLPGVFNVAPDGWIGAETFRELAGEPSVRLPANVGKTVLDTARRYGIGSIPQGIEPYVQFPWVVANDRLRDAGWVPAFSNEEAYVLGTPAPPWAMSAKRRQEVALGAVSAGVAGAAAVGLALARRVVR